MKVKRNTLLLLACLIWSAVGFNILRIALMTGGIWLRSSGLTPERFIAFFYTGLGASLLLAGLLFGRNFAKAAVAAKAKL